MPDVLPLKFPSPAYAAVITWFPATSPVVLKVAWPLESDPDPSTALPSLNTTVPVGIVAGDPAMRATLAQPDAWKSVRAIREGHALVAPALPFGWVEEPPSINRLLGRVQLHQRCISKPARLELWPRQLRHPAQPGSELSLESPQGKPRLE